MKAAKPRASLRIQEQFVSIQGEGAWVGTPSRFIRISGCNLRCSWCDSPASSWAPEGAALTVEALIAAAQGGPAHVVVTGGEPLLFPATASLVHGLRAQGHTVTIETAGTVHLEGLRCELMSISPKLAHSEPDPRRTRLATVHAERRFKPDTVRQLMRQADEFQLKYVVRANALEADLAEIDAQLAEIDPERRLDPSQVFLMPEGTDAETLRAAYLTVGRACLARGFRLGQRLHIEMFGHTPGT